MIDNPPTTFTVTHYNTKITIELNHSDLDMEELIDVFRGLAMAMGFSEETWKIYVPE